MVTSLSYTVGQAFQSWPTGPLESVGSHRVTRNEGSYTTWSNSLPALHRSRPSQQPPRSPLQATLLRHSSLHSPSEETEVTWSVQQKKNCSSLLWVLSVLEPFMTLPVFGILLFMTNQSKPRQTWISHMPHLIVAGLIVIGGVSTTCSVAAIVRRNEIRQRIGVARIARET